MVCPIALGDHNKAQTCTQGTQNCTSLITLKTNLNNFTTLHYQQNIIHWLLVKVLHLTRHKIGHFGDVLEANLLASYGKHKT